MVGTNVPPEELDVGMLEIATGAPDERIEGMLEAVEPGLEDGTPVPLGATVVAAGEGLVEGARLVEGV